MFSYIYQVQSSGYLLRKEERLRLVAKVSTGFYVFQSLGFYL